MLGLLCVHWYNICVLWERRFFLVFLHPYLLLSWMFEHDCLDKCCFGCLICMCFVFATVQCKLACFTWVGILEIRSLLSLLKLALQWLPCCVPGILVSALALVGLVSVYCDWVRQQVWSATSILVWQHVQLLKQTPPWDTLACCWAVKQASNYNNIVPTQVNNLLVHGTQSLIINKEITGQRVV